MKRTHHERMLVNKTEERDMKVVMTSVMCSPRGNAFQGTVLDIGKDETQEVEIDGKATQVPLAQYMIEKNFARPFDQQRDAKARQHGLVKAER